MQRPAPDTRPDLPNVLLRRAAIFYALMALAAALWNVLRGRGFPLSEAVGWPLSVAFGLAGGALTLGLGYAAYFFFPAMRRLSGEMARMLVGHSSRVSLVALAALSGVGEEMFFRGAVQPEFGLVAASLVFGLLHIGPGRRYLLWTVWAVGAGFLFGGLYALTGGVLAPVVAHVLHNAATLLLWKRRLKDGGDGP